MIALLSCACAREAPPRPQWVVTVSSDAPVPELADRLLVQVVDASGNPCASCSRTFALGGATALPLSFGIEPGALAQPRLLATMFRADQAGSDGLPQDAAHFEALGQLPPASGITAVSLELPAACFGVAADVSAGTTCDPSTRGAVPAPTLGDGPALVAGTWGPGQPVPCPGATPARMTCVPGGVFLMGSYDAVDLGGGAGAVPEHLVQLSPFFLDTDEVKVGDVRALLASSRLAASMAPLLHVSDPTQLAAGCTYLGPSDTANDDMPVSCVTFDQAAAVCKALGKRLPTEAEWEYAARNTTEETTYAWGEIGDVCTETVVARGRSNTVTAVTVYEYDTCRVEADGGLLPWGAHPVGSTATDVTTLGIHDLGGNVAEWLQDYFQTYDDTCWTGGAPQLVDPSCTVPSKGFADEHATRGGGWTLEGYYAASAMRDPMFAFSSLPGYGVRCAQSP